MVFSSAIRADRHSACSLFHSIVTSLGRVNAVLGQHIVEGILRRTALSAGVDGFATQILHGVNGIATLYNVQAHPAY